MATSFAKLFDDFFDSRMEGFETAFPAVVEKVNDDGTIDAIPSIRNVLKNMQIEPDGKNGKPLPIEGIPLLNLGSSGAVFEFEIAKGCPVLLIASSRDLRSWIDAGEDGGVTTPLSFSGNDLNDLVAIPLTSTTKKNKAKILVKLNGEIEVETNADVSVKANQVDIDANKLTVSGDIECNGNISADMEISAMVLTPASKVSLSKHVHNSAAGPTSPPTTSTSPPTTGV